MQVLIKFTLGCFYFKYFYPFPDLYMCFESSILFHCEFIIFVQTEMSCNYFSIGLLMNRVFHKDSGCRNSIEISAL